MPPKVAKQHLTAKKEFVTQHNSGTSTISWYKRRLNEQQQEIAELQEQSECLKIIKLNFESLKDTLRELIFARTNLRGFHGFWPKTRN